MLPVVLKSEEVEELFRFVSDNVGAKLQIDLNKQTVTGPTGKIYTFEVDSFRKYCLYNGLDDIGLTLKQENKIGEFEKKQKEVEPWLYSI